MTKLQNNQYNIRYQDPIFIHFVRTLLRLIIKAGKRILLKFVLNVIHYQSGVALELFSVSVKRLTDKWLMAASHCAITRDFHPATTKIFYTFRAKCRIRWDSDLGRNDAANYPVYLLVHLFRELFPDSIIASINL